LKGDVEKFGERIQADGGFYFFGKQVFVGNGGMLSGISHGEQKKAPRYDAGLLGSVDLLNRYSSFAFICFTA
jgi:hypothetical protein